MNIEKRQELASQLEAIAHTLREPESPFVQSKPSAEAVVSAKYVLSMSHPPDYMAVMAKYILESSDEVGGGS